MNVAAKQQAHAIIDTLPDTATWSELLYALELRADSDSGLADAEADRVTDVGQLRHEYDRTR